MWSSVSPVGVARQAQRGQVGAQPGQRLLVEVAGEVEGAVGKHLRACPRPTEQRVVLGGGRALRRGGAHGRHQRLPGRLEEAAGLRRLGHGHLELLQQRGIGRGQPQPGQQAVQLGTGQFLAVVGGKVAKAQGAGKGSEHRDRTWVHSQIGDAHFVRIGVDVDHAAVAAHLQPLGAAPWKAGWPASLAIMPSMACRCRRACRSARRVWLGLVQHPRRLAGLAAVGQPQARLQRDGRSPGRWWRTGRTARSSSR
jgi:hypothetical protein